MKNLNSLERLVTIVVGAVIAIVAFNFWVGSDIFYGWFAPNPPEGFDTVTSALGAGDVETLQAVGRAEFFAQGMEIVATILSIIGVIGIAIPMKIIRFIAGAFEGTAVDFAKSKNKADRQTTIHHIREEVTQGTNPMPPKQIADYQRVLLQAVATGNRRLTISMAEEIFGEPFLTEPKKSQSTVVHQMVDDIGFPSTKGGE